MNVNEVLAEMRRLQTRLIMGGDYYPTAVARLPDLERLAELAFSLDEWLSNGHALPDEWAKKRA